MRARDTEAGRLLFHGHHWDCDYGHCAPQCTMSSVVPLPPRPEPPPAPPGRPATGDVIVSFFDTDGSFIGRWFDAAAVPRVGDLVLPPAIAEREATFIARHRVTAVEWPMARHAYVRVAVPSAAVDYGPLAKAARRVVDAAGYAHDSVCPIPVRLINELRMALEALEGA